MVSPIDSYFCQKWAKYELCATFELGFFNFSWAEKSFEFWGVQNRLFLGLPVLVVIVKGVCPGLLSLLSLDFPHFFPINIFFLVKNAVSKWRSTLRS